MEMTMKKNLVDMFPVESLRTYLSSVIQGLQTLVFPPICIACEKSGDYYCSKCEAQWSGSARLVDKGEIPIYSTMPYDLLSANVVLAAKEEGIYSARHLLACSLGSAITSALRKYELNFNNQLTRRAYREITLVPIPSRASSERVRGERFLLPIINQALKNVVTESKLQVSELLIHKRKVKDQSGLTFRERSANMSGAITLSESILRVWKPTPIIVIDDVITTGSTMKSAFSALHERNLTVLAGASACASIARMRIR
jgi:predicted amidophosphoribosyltransferase